ncbi:MAG TPA: decaprenyl-phosphate phosphoribosyltransferase, partial [Candidatus Saccharimonadia bacterium]|nr:decaprenyl-phosphate phosphoribosyltransferase [Candidatus Saccharimonadia bacterium]
MQESPGSRSVLLLSWVRLLRPKQWVKNVFMLPGPLFGHILLNWHSVGRIGGAFAMFCLLSSAVYVVNDVLDVEEDRNHPEKRSRPVA